MFWKPTFILTASLALNGMASAQAQPQVDVLIFDQAGGTQHGVSASGALGYTWVRVVTEGGYLQYMPSQQWDLVIFEMPKDLVTQKETVAQLLEDHVAAGGRLLVNFNNLDEWPRLQRLLGVDDAIERFVPSDVTQTNPPHPSYPNVGWSFRWQASPWVDSGDSLVPSTQATTAAIFKDNELGAVIIANDRHTIVNGFDWESYPGGAGFSLAKFQVEYLMTCPADFDQSTGIGTLDIFDFLEFQRLFVEQDYRANMAFDENLDIFDFLAFQNEFVSGCP